MNRKFSLPILALAALLLGGSLLSSCSKKEEDMTPVQPGETETYRDQVFKFSFKAPKNWIAESAPGTKTAYYSSQGAITRFSKFTEGDLGAKIEVGADRGKTKEQAIEDYKQSYSGITFGASEPSTLGGQPGLKITFKAEGNDPDALTGYRIYTDKDSVVTYFEAATFGEKRMAKYKPVFELAEKSVVPGYLIKATGGKLDSASEARMMADAKPTETFNTFNGNGFSIEYPSNFNATGAARGAVIKGDRNDATIQVDVLDAGGAENLDSYAQENAKKTYRGAAVANATVGGQPAKVISYSFREGTASKAFFVMKGKSVYRITINWPTSLADDFRPALEKSATSLKMK